MFKLMRIALNRLSVVLVLILPFVVTWPVAAANIYIDYTCTLHQALNAANKDHREGECEAG